jgi:hypothetical protein
MSSAHSPPGEQVDAGQDDLPTMMAVRARSTGTHAAAMPFTTTPLGTLPRPRSGKILRPKQRSVTLNLIADDIANMSAFEYHATPRSRCCAFLAG